MHDFRGFCVYRSESSYNILLPIDHTDEHKWKMFLPTILTTLRGNQLPAALKRETISNNNNNGESTI